MPRSLDGSERFTGPKVKMEDGTEEEREFAVLLLDESTREQHVEQKIAETHHALVDKRP